VYAHRGGAALRPENTLIAFDHGLSFGADGLEFDVHLSRDGVVVVHHDDTLDRTTNGRGPISAHSIDELERLDAGYWFQPEGPGPGFPFRGQDIAIPRLSDVLRRYRSIPLIIEMKAGDPELAQRTIEEVRAADAVDRVVLGSFYWRALHHAREGEPRIRTGSSREETRLALYKSYVRWPLTRARFHEFQVPEAVGGTTVVTPRFIEHAHRAGLPVKVWTVDDRHDMRRLITWGVDGLISDRPDVAVEVVRGR
jgi:glycerophosphoryl diester phosphodiesterase